MDIRNRPGLCKRPNEISARNKPTLQLRNHRRKNQWILPFPKGFYGPADIHTIFQEKIDRKLGHETPVWLDDIIKVTRGTKEKHTRKLESVLTKLENEGYKASKKKSKFYLKEKLNPPTNTKTLKSFLGRSNTLQNSFQTYPKKTDNMRQLLKKNTKWEWTEERNRFQQNQERTNFATMPCTLQRKQRKHCNHRR